jgi:hypothetical protein
MTDADREITKELVDRGLAPYIITKQDRVLFAREVAEQQEDKVPIWLVGDNNKRFIEYPLIRKDNSWTWGLSFNNSRAVTMVLFDRDNKHHYNWAKRFENMWTQVTLSYNSEEKSVYFYINDELITQMNGIKQNIPFPIKSDLSQADVLCKATSFPSMTIGQIEVFNQGRKLVIPGDTSFSTTWDVTFYGTEDHALRKDLISWMVSADHFQKNTHSGNPNNILGELSVEQLDSAGNATVKYTFHNVFVFLENQLGACGVDVNVVSL